MTRAIGLDIGGANIKASDGQAWAASVPFPLWRDPGGLAAAVAEMIGGREFDFLAVSMTGELCDCFASKAEGVCHIVDAVLTAADGRPVVFWQTAGEFVPPDVATEFWVLTAAANWHALATWVGRMNPGGRVALIDVGSTTTDLIPIDGGIPTAAGTDPMRLAEGTLVYTGVRRTPLCAVAREVCGYGVAAEWFATADDVWLLRGEVAESGSTGTADGRPRTRDAAARRVARMVCADAGEVDADAIAEAFAAEQVRQVRDACGRVFAEPPDQIVFSGEGEFLARAATESLWPGAPRTSLSGALGLELSVAACATAAARLAEGIVVTGEREASASGGPPAAPHTR